MTYKPKPLDTTKVVLPECLEDLKENLASHIHDIWAGKRIDEGWSFGPVHDGHKKKHPDLVKYEDLPESEKEYDRDTAIETLKAIIALGYRIEKE
jgi:hypothetical protein